MSAILPVRAVEKPWGREVLPEPFAAPDGRRIGEIWFEPPAQLPQLLVKYIFTSEKLSVQVHPSDAQRPGHGKEECWLIVDAEPGAKLGIGFRKDLDGSGMRAAALDGSIEDLLEWHEVRQGDFFYIPANTVHAIGAGISLIEVQQNSDTTYRLYDYGRPRELHLDEAVAVASGAPFAPRLRKSVPPTGNSGLVEGPLFRLHQVEGAPDEALMRLYRGPLLVLPRRGSIRIGATEVASGGCGVAADIHDVLFEPSGLSLIAQPCGT